ncbi:MAG: Uma2 family endonuclease [Rhizobiaceae bacterium]|nr:Uma2 family endonuclease [Rhizobiaceae bacterium]
MSDTAKPLPRMTVDEFLAWSQGREGRYELHDGEVITMRPERLAHVAVKLGVFLAFRSALKTEQTGCTAFGDGVTIKVDRLTAFEPDCTIHCGPVDFNALLVDHPVVVVEVLSPSSRAADLIRKLGRYFEVPSIQHYLIIDTDKRTTIHYRRNGQEIACQILGGGVLSLDPPGIDVQIDEFFADLPPIEA